MTLAIWIITAAAVLSALGVIWTKAVRPIVRGVQIVKTIVERELNHNGGSSVKDHAKKAADETVNLVQKIQAIEGAQETIYELLDNVVESKGEAHEEIWQALRALGVDRRRS